MHLFISFTSSHTLLQGLYSWFVMMKLRQTNFLNRNSQINWKKWRTVIWSSSKGKVLHVVLIDRWPSGFCRRHWLTERTKLQLLKFSFEYPEWRYFPCKINIILCRNATTSVNSNCRKFRVGRKLCLPDCTGTLKHLARGVLTVMR